MTAGTSTTRSARLARRVAPVLLATTVGGLVLAGSAAASDQPVVGSAACSTAVEHSSTVQEAGAGLDRAQGPENTASIRLTSASNEFAAARKALATVHPGEPGYAGIRERYEEARTAVAQATAAKHTADAGLARARGGLARARSDAQDRLCRPVGSTPPTTTPPTTTPPTTTPPTTTPPTTDPGHTVPPRLPVSCRTVELAVTSGRHAVDEDEQARSAAAAAHDALEHDLAVHASAEVIVHDRARVEHTEDALRTADDHLRTAHRYLAWAQDQAHRAGLHCGTESGEGDGGSGDGVDPIGADGSIAVVSGDEVTEVPLGSAQTGEA